MTLSEAIRLGSLLHPQGIGGQRISGTCALMAAADAVGLPDEWECTGSPCVDYIALRERFPILKTQRVPKCPVPGCYESTPSLEHAIWRANDKARWTREKIADLVEVYESAAVAEPETEKVAQ